MVLTKTIGSTDKKVMKRKLPEHVVQKEKKCTNKISNK